VATALKPVLLYLQVLAPSHSITCSMVCSAVPAL